MINHDIIQAVKKMIKPTMLKVTLKGGEVGLVNPIDYLMYGELDFAGEDGNKVIDAKDIADANLVEE
jgi:hypothetical protein